MATCAYCGTGILFGGRRVGELRYCNATCQQRANLVAWSQTVAEPYVQQQVMTVYQGLCQVCKGSGPVDVHFSYWVWSALLLTRWGSESRISCRSCGVKKQLGGLATSLVVGWWGIPWGLIMTPLQIGRNVSGLLSSTDPTHPSAGLERAVRVNVGAQVAQAQTAPKTG